MGLFKIPTIQQTSAESPVLLFRDLKRDSTIKFLWGHQEKVLDAYHASHLDTKDLAIELPTGTGKTLVGLLMGEFRRQSKKERVVFLCSNKQLCAQVHAQAQKYGIPVSLLTGGQNSYDEEAFYGYQQAKALGISTYSGLFNTNPRINDPHVIICDDAHAAESFISDMWTLRISRENQPKLFQQIYALLKTLMTDTAVYQFDNSKNAEKLVELISPIALHPIKNSLADAVTGFLVEYSELKYAWQFICNHLSACNLYFTADQIEVRPILPPTLTHEPFQGARQRLYMSATLGEDGDLERSFGIKTIVRLPIPEGWDKRGTGRRLILFPEVSSKIEHDFLGQLLLTAKRTLILVPNNRTRDAYCDELKNTVSVLAGSGVEKDVETFRSHPGPVVLVLANRYDGIDFPGDDCRCLIVCEVPKGAGLQETFFTQRLKAFLITRDRVRTRVTQAMGRCTRDESDYSVVLVFGDELVKWFCTAENVAGMHPELQAEISFGFENSTDRPSQAFLELCKAFLSRAQEWDLAESYIKADGAKRQRVPDVGASALQKAAASEIDYSYALWNGQYEKAYGFADSVLACLSGGEEMRSYRCFWQHQAAVAAFLTWKQPGKEPFRNLAIDRLNKAAAGNFGLRWLTRLATELGGESTKASESIAEDEWFSAIEQLLAEVGLAGSKFDRVVAEKRDFIKATEAKRFHQGLAFLGKMLGARTHEWGGDAKPDGFWNLAYWKGFVFEAKTREFAPGAISVTTVRQALTHEKCVKDDRLLPEFTACHTVVISPRTTIELEARGHAAKLCYCSHADLIGVFDKAVAAFTELRRIAPGLPQDLAPREAVKIYRKHDVFADSVSSLLISRRLANLPLRGAPSGSNAT